MPQIKMQDIWNKNELVTNKQPSKNLNKLIHCFMLFSSNGDTANLFICEWIKYTFLNSRIMAKNPLHYFKKGNFYFTQYTKLRFHIHKIEHLYNTWLDELHFPYKAVHWHKNTYKPWGWNTCLQFEEFEIGLMKGSQFYWSTKLIFKAKVCRVLWNHKKFSHKIIKSEIKHTT
jgi:hypothetical protein